MLAVGNCLRRIEVLLSPSPLGGLIKDVISAYKAQPCLGSVGNSNTAEHFFHAAHWLRKAIMACVQLMFSARWLCSQRGYLCVVGMRCITFGTRFYRVTLQHTGQYFIQVAFTWSDTHTHRLHKAVLSCSCFCRPSYSKGSAGLCPQSGWVVDLQSLLCIQVLHL